MKSMFLLLLSLSFLLVGDVQARSIMEMMRVIKEPIVIKAGKSRRMDVTFQHNSHKGISCMQCHHLSGDKGRYVPCVECHAKPGPRERDPMSMFMAFHARDTQRSCLGCHKQKVLDRPDKFAAGLLSGHIGLLADGLPVGFLLPGTLALFFLGVHK